MGMSRSDYDEITAFSVDGTGQNQNLKQSFVVPPRFCEPFSSPSLEHTVNIMLAWVSDSWVWALVDFKRLARFYIVSRDRPWSSADINPKSSVKNKYIIAIFLLINS